MNPISAYQELTRALQQLSFAPPVTHVYDPLQYAWAPHQRYLERYGRGFAEGQSGAILLGMNPGPFGMAQTGVPFGDVAMARDWLGICEPVQRPAHEHPKRPITGFDCPRSEVSGTRFWSWARDAYGTPDAFARQFFVANYCPLCFMEESGRNRTPDKLKAPERRALFDLCDRALRRVVDHLKPTHVIGIGAFAEARARAALDGLDLSIGRILHPSPANPRANRGWADAATAELQALGIELQP
jgi:single-strand selective monofunctional uracil DNA glycosylase